MSSNEKTTKGMKPARIKRNTTEYFQVWSLALIPLILVVVFYYLPMVGVIIAFKDYNYVGGIFGSPWVGLRNFKLLITSNVFTRITTNTLYMNFIMIIVGMIAAVGVALFLFRLKSRNATKLYQTVMITPNFLSWVVASYMVFAILHPSNGTLNSLLNAFGVKDIDWYAKPEAWPTILTVSSIWKHVGMDSLLYYATLMGVDSSLVEAAQVDGATKRQIDRHIMIPALAGIMCIQLILKVGGIFRADFGLFYQIPRNVGALYSTTDVIDTYIFRAMRETGDMGTSSATGLLQSVVGFIMVIGTNFVVNKIDSEKALF